MNSYIALTISIISEVFATTMLKMSDGFTNPVPSIGVIVGYAVSFYCLSVSLKMIPLSLAYAIWAGAGTALTTLIGVLVWQDPFNSLTLIGLMLIIGGIIVLNSSKAESRTKETANL